MNRHKAMLLQGFSLGSMQFIQGGQQLRRAYRRTVDTLAGVLSGLWPGAAAGGRAIPAATSAAIDEVLWGNADKCERLRSMFKAHAQRVKGAG